MFSLPWQDSDYDGCVACLRRSRPYPTLIPSTLSLTSPLKHWSASDSSDSRNESSDQLMSDEELHSGIDGLSVGYALNGQDQQLRLCACAPPLVPCGIQEPCTACACTGDEGQREECVMERALNADSVFGGSLSAEPYPEDRCTLDGIAEDLLSAGVPDFSEVPVEDGCLGFDRDPFCLEAVDNDVSVGGRTPACMSIDYFM